MFTTNQCQGTSFFPRYPSSTRKFRHKSKEIRLYKYQMYTKTFAQICFKSREEKTKYFFLCFILMILKSALCLKIVPFKMSHFNFDFAKKIFIFWKKNLALLAWQCCKMRPVWLIFKHCDGYYIHQGDWVIRYSTKRYFHGVIKAWNGHRIELIKYAPFYSQQQSKGKRTWPIGTQRGAKFAYHTLA